MAAALLALGAGAARATVITAFPVDFAVAEGTQFDGAVATFEDDNPGAFPSDFTATIDWGDGSPTTPATGIGSNSAAFVVLGQHTYADEGSFTVTVTINDVAPGTGTATATDTATVTESDALSGTPQTFAVPVSVSFTRTVATFTDTYTGNVAADFTATIDWGDATSSAGTVSGGGGAFSVAGTHTYASTGTFTVQVTLSDDKPGTATATVNSTAQVVAGLAVVANGFAVNEGTPFNGQVATVADSDTNINVGQLNATIDWADGTQSAGVITGSAGTFTVTGQHTYTDEGSFNFTVTVTETAGGLRTASGSATAAVAESDVLAGFAVPIAATQGIPFTGSVATFTDTYTGNNVGDFTASIDWGDGNTSLGVITGGGANYTVSGTHTYAAAGPFTVTVTMVDDPPGTASAVATSAASVAAAPVVVIPTLDARGLALLALAVLGAAVYALRLRRRTGGA